MAKIIISYRRADSETITGRIRDRLAVHYGEDSVFMDIDSIPLGVDYRKQISDALAQNEILVVVIGPKWRGPLKGGQFRLDSDADPVRVEVATALERGIPTIPVLVNGGVMPNAEDLPDCQRRSKNASVFRSKNTSMMLARRPPNRGPFR